MTINETYRQAFPAAPYSEVVFPDDEYVAVPKTLLAAALPSGAVWLWLLLACLSEGHPEVEPPTTQLERHTGWTGYTIGEYVSALCTDSWLATRKGSMPGTYAYQILRQPTDEQIRGWALDLDAPKQLPEAHRPSGPPAGAKHSAEFWRGLVADGRPPQ